MTLTLMPGADDLGDRLEALAGGGDLDHDVGLGDLVPELVGLVDRGLGVVGEVGGDLDGDAAVESGGAVVDGAEDARGLADVAGGDLEDRAVDVGAVGRELADLGVVRLALGEGRREDGGVRGDADDVALGDHLLDALGIDALAGQVVEPDADARGGELRGGGSGVGHVAFFMLVVRYRGRGGSAAPPGTRPAACEAGRSGRAGGERSSSAAPLLVSF
ncbi:hypothetical protein QFZ62_000246 [Clavibacter sp. B3I6]|nr:hypothetical protein [Clavibacter sp. B3I6]